MLEVAETSSDEVHKLPVLCHSSQVKTRAACNCGRRQGEREDPFDHRVRTLPLSIDVLVSDKVETQL